MSEPRLSLETAPEATQALRELERYLARSGLPRALVELVKLRVSMFNVEPPLRRVSRASGERASCPSVRGSSSKGQES
jgi:hypothetical protein